MDQRPKHHGWLSPSSSSPCELLVLCQKVFRGLKDAVGQLSSDLRDSLVLLLLLVWMSLLSQGSESLLQTSNKRVSP